LAWTPFTEHVLSPTPQHRVSIAYTRASRQTAFQLIILTWKALVVYK
jgi:hypothetical protein